MGAINGEAKELIEMLLGLASRAGWKGTARMAEGYAIALRVHRRPVEVPEPELRRRARAVRG
jgi:hypothetical protein